MLQSSQWFLSTFAFSKSCSRLLTHGCCLILKSSGKSDSLPLLSRCGPPAFKLVPNNLNPCLKTVAFAIIISPTKRIQRFWLCSVYLSDQGTLPEVLQVWRVCLESRSHSGITPTCIRFQSSNTVRVNVFLPHAVTTEDPPCLVRVKPIRHDYDDQRRRQRCPLRRFYLREKRRSRKAVDNRRPLTESMLCCW